jgi:PKD repeat protein
VSKNLDTFKLNFNTLKVFSERTKNGLYIVQGISNFKKADSLEWDLGNGIKFKTTDFNYVFKNSGTYFIKLTVYDTCGIREIYRKVVFKPIIKPKKPIKKKKN